MAATEEIEKEILAEMAANPVPYAAGQVNDVITIDGETRMISVPASEIFFGVESDKDVERKHFRCPKVVGDGIDLSKHQIYISYITSDSAGKTFSGNAGLYLCEDVATDGDDITFSWQLSGNVFASAGFIAFKVLAAKTDGENVQTRWNTVPAIGTVLMTVPDGMDIGEAYPDIVTQLLERMASVEKIATEEAMQGYVNTYLEAHPGEIDETLTDPKKAAPASVVGELKEDIENLSQKIFDEVLEHSSQLFDSSMANLNGYYNSAGTWSSNSDFSTQKICPIKPDTDIYTYRTFTYSSFFDVHGNWIESNINSPVETVIHAPKNAYTMYIGTATSIINQLFVSYSPDFYIWNHDANYIANRIEGITSYNYYNLPFIKKGRLCCNIDDDTTTAYYLGVNANTKINLIRSKFIFENYNQRSGTVAMILLGNGCNKIQNIVDLSVHCTITSTYLSVDVFGKKFGTQKYQNIISSDLETALVMDNQTEHDAYMLVSNNTVIVNIDGTNYKGVFTPTSDISSLNDVIGNYAVLEHYCNGPRYGFNMPQFTYFQLKSNNTVILSDTFHRQDGVPQVSPQGHLYATYSYLNNID